MKVVAVCAYVAGPLAGVGALITAIVLCALDNRVYLTGTEANLIVGGVLAGWLVPALGLGLAALVQRLEPKRAQAFGVAQLGLDLGAPLGRRSRL